MRPTSSMVFLAATAAVVVLLCSLPPTAGTLAPKVALYADTHHGAEDNYLNYTYGGYDKSSLVELEQLLATLGYDVVLLDNVSDSAAVQSVLDSGVTALVFPDLDFEASYAVPGLSDVLKSYVFNGGNAVWLASQYLADVMGFIPARDGVKSMYGFQKHYYGDWAQTAAAAGTAFSAGPATLEQVGAWGVFVLPGDGTTSPGTCSYALSTYDNAANTACLVYSMPVCNGIFTFLAWGFDTYSGGKRAMAENATNWVEVLVIALSQVPQATYSNTNDCVVALPPSSSSGGSSANGTTSSSGGDGGGSSHSTTSTSSGQSTTSSGDGSLSTAGSGCSRLLSFWL